MRQHIAKLIAASFLLAAIGSQAAQKSPIYIIYDSSNSMWGVLDGEQRKYEAARKALGNYVDTQIEGREVAFRAYGHNRADDCTDSELIVPFTSENVGEEIKAAVNGIRPTGQTPIDYSLRRALEDFGDRSGEILLLTDGIESCDADPCALLAAWKEKNVKVNVHVVGIGLSEKEKVAIQCLADAAGTEFLDAQTEEEIAESLTTATAPKPEWDPTPGDFHLTVNYDNGRKINKQLFAYGTLTPLDEHGELLKISSNGRFTPLPGKYTLEVGVKVRSGELYQPITREIDILPRKSHRVTMSPVIPPAVQTVFLELGEPARPGHVRAFQDNVEVFSFRGRDITFVPEGTFDFKSSPNWLNKNLWVTETFAAGDFKTVTFILQETVKIYARMTAQNSGNKFTGILYLEQDGQESGVVRSGNGALVIPGTHDIILRDGLDEYRTTIEVGHKENQQFDLVVPAGNFRFHYQNMDGSKQKSKRIFIYGPKGSKSFSSETTVALLPGEYRIVGHPKANFEEQKLTVTAGDDKDIVFRAIKN